MHSETHACVNFQLGVCCMALYRTNVCISLLLTCQQRQPLLAAPTAHSATSLALQCTVLLLCHVMAGAWGNEDCTAALSAVSWRQHPTWALRA